MGDIDMQTRPVGYDDFPAVRRLFRRVWNEERDERYDRMRFQQTLNGLPVGHVAVIDADIVGYFMLWPMELTDGRRVISAGQAMDVMTDERCRGKGVFPSLATATLRSAAERGMQLVFGAPNEAIFQTYLKRLAWANPTKIRTYVRPLSLSGITPFAGVANPLLAALSARKAANHRLTCERPSDDAIAGCLEASAITSPCWRVKRSVDWYNFRLQPNGKFTYHWCAAWRDDVLCAFSVWGVADATGARARRANLADVIGVDEKSRRLAVSGAITAARSAGANYMSGTLTSDRQAETLRANGFFLYRKAPLIARTLDHASFAANPYLKTDWDLFGADFDFV